MADTLKITDAGGGTRRLELAGSSLTIGRGEGCGLVLAGSDVSKRHARLRARGSAWEVEDLGSTNGTFLNGSRLAGPRELGVGDELGIGTYRLSLGRDTDVPGAKEAGETRTAAPSPASQKSGRAGGDPPSPALERAPGQTDGRRPAAPANRGEDRAALRKELHDRLIEALDLRRLDLDKLGDDQLRARSEKALEGILADLGAQGRLESIGDRRQLLADVIDEVLGLGPLEELLADDEISEVMVNHADQIFVEKHGRIVPCEKTFSSNRAVLAVIERIVAPIGRRIDESSPLVDARLKDGSRVHAVIPPLALKGPCITIRKFKREKLTAPDLVRFGSMTERMARLLEIAVLAKKNIVISGGTGSGKTTLLNVLTSFIPEGERIVTVEDAAELQIRQAHWVQLESRPPNLEGKGAITIRELVKNCLRMRPDRIVVGECRAGEALDMLQAMNTGHDGSLTTLHANTPRDALSRLETMCLMSGMDLPVRAIREQVASAVDLIVQQTRCSDGSRRVTSITELTGMEGDIVTLQEIFAWDQQGYDAEGRVVGRHVASGFIPKFCEDLSRRGMAVTADLFREE
ncbi:ATPase, T2SS/T4P/T4SS family [Vulgatibacter incomptus]|uniref:Type II/IV secretion system ATP hydrolase TadA/VirB11/CpaF, TadA subfamily n=1 Tax=Vulgatibacter incomptus TaxID=1391653 RepID=A0A0K1PDC7_9BACT|nr:ATPase, T2SS/T4P/T4SS family [Vulgatibacter incomptus]AKU91525.1 Type II/IV secretion system ATP hydrolase TadA/VirB11/CpaF, TadA subfamily [Vulgatibacter incomptus]